MQDFRNFWNTSTSFPFLNTPLTDELIQESERKLGVKLPRAYLSILRVQNGGVPRCIRHRLGEGPVCMIAGLGDQFPSLLQFDWSDLKAARPHDLPADIDSIIPFSSDGRFFYAFDYRYCRSGDEPRIICTDVETLKREYVIAEDFASFIDGLEANEEDEAADTFFMSFPY